VQVVGHNYERRAWLAMVLVGCGSRTALPLDNVGSPDSTGSAWPTGEADAVAPDTDSSTVGTTNVEGGTRSSMANASAMADYDGSEPAWTLSDGGGLDGDFASCLSSGPGIDDCGLTNDESCCASLLINGGMFFRTYESTPIGPMAESDPASVADLRLDKYEVTVGRFRQFVAAWRSGYLPPEGSGRHVHLNGGAGLSATGGGYEAGWASADDAEVAPTDANLACAPEYAVTWTPTPGDQEKLPITCVNWWEAYAFCIWDGGFLPTEAEWEYAAAGGSALRTYPWGTEQPGTTNQYAIYGCYYQGDGACSVAPVGFPVDGTGAWGQLDLAGNVMEWALDFRADYVTPCINCADLSIAGERVTRGGNFSDPVSTLGVPTRFSETPATRDYSVGLRCARGPS
jgi:formylglycine-generating enzyme